MAVDQLLFYQPSPLRVGDGFEAIVCAQLAVDMMQVISHRLSRYQRASEGRGVVALCEKGRNPALLIGGRRNRRLMRCVFGERNELARTLDHAVKELLVSMSLIDIVRQTYE